MKKIIVAAIAALAFVSLSCASNPKVSGLLSLDEAIEGAAAAIEGRVAGGTEIAVYKITAPHDEIGDYLAEDLNDRISMRGNLVPLARGTALQNVEAEHEFQMSGLVSDESAVGIGHYLGAKVVITGTFNRYADFSQFRLRAINVETSALLYSYTSRINNADRVLANITAPFTLQAPRITEDALAHLNRGKDLYAEDKFDEAIAEFDKAIAINRDLAEAYYLRGTSYGNKGDYDREIMDLNEAIRLNPNYVGAYNNRGFAYNSIGDNDRAINDLNQALRLNPNLAEAYNNRGIAYFGKGEHDRAMADFSQAIRLAPNFALAYNNRGSVYSSKREFDNAITDYSQAIRLNTPNLSDAYNNRGNIYCEKGDFDRGIADYEAALKIDPNHTRARNNLVVTFNDRGVQYYNRGDLDRAIADFEAALRLNPNHTNARNNLEAVRRQRGR